jgi:hypothetical protein
LTRACLKDPRVARAIGDGDDEYGLLLRLIQEANEYAVYALTEGGYKGSALQALLKAVPEAQHVLNRITEKHSKERILLLTKANTHGKKHYATGGSHVCSDDFLKAEAVCCRDD